MSAGSRAVFSSSGHPHIEPGGVQSGSFLPLLLLSPQLLSPAILGVCTPGPTPYPTLNPTLNPTPYPKIRLGVLLLGRLVGAPRGGLEFDIYGLKFCWGVLVGRGGGVEGDGGCVGRTCQVRVPAQVHDQDVRLNKSVERGRGRGVDQRLCPRELVPDLLKQQVLRPVGQRARGGGRGQVLFMSVQGKGEWMGDYRSRKQLSATYSTGAETPTLLLSGRQTVPRAPQNCVCACLWNMGCGCGHGERGCALRKGLAG